jgi:hypothetical protein
VYKNKVFLLFTIENVGFYGNQLLELKIGSGVVPRQSAPIRKSLFVAGAITDA